MRKVVRSVLLLLLSHQPSISSECNRCSLVQCYHACAFWQACCTRVSVCKVVLCLRKKPFWRATREEGWRVCSKTELSKKTEQKGGFYGWARGKSLNQKEKVESACCVLWTSVCPALLYNRQKLKSIPEKRKEVFERKNRFILDSKVYMENYRT